MRPAPVVFLLFLFLGVSSAQVGEISVSLGESLFKNNKLGFADAATQYQLNDGFGFAARLTLNTKRFLGHEFGYAYTHPKLAITGSGSESGMGGHSGIYELLLYFTPECPRIVPSLAACGTLPAIVLSG